MMCFGVLDSTVINDGLLRLDTIEISIQMHGRMDLKMTRSTNTLNGDSEVDEDFLQMKFVQEFLHRFHVETFN
jgi:hypothetical protein